MTRSYSSFNPLRPRKREGSLESIIIGAFCWKSLSKCPSIIPIELHNNADFKFRFTEDFSAACSSSSRLLLLLLDFKSFILTSTGPESPLSFWQTNISLYEQFTLLKVTQNNITRCSIHYCILSTV